MKMADPLEELYLKYNKMIYSFLYRSTLNPHQAEELTQETFLKAFKAIHRFRGESSLKTWLFKIARNTYLNETKKKTNQLEDQFDPIATDIADKHNDYKASEDKMLIRNVLRRISVKDRTFIILRDQNELSYHEIADIMEISAGQVKVGIYRARKKFRTIYSKETGDYR